MASNPEDVFAALKVAGTSQPGFQPVDRPPETKGTPSADPNDVFAPLAIPGTPSGTPMPDLRETNSLGEEFVAGLGSGIDGFQGSLYGVAGLVGRELQIGWLEDVGNENAERNFEEAGQNGRQSEGFSDIESAGGFFRWASASLGEAIPSLAFAMTGAGIGATAGKKAVELGVKKSIARSVQRRMAKNGFSVEESMLAARDYMTSKTGQTALARAYTQQRTRKVIDEAKSAARRTGGKAGLFAASALPQIGAVDQELVRAGVADPGLTALLAGSAAGALETIPALRLLDKMFPGVDRAVSKTFVKDFAVSTGTQAALEGSTEGAQEIITLAALAFEDPTFDMFSPDARRRVVDAFAAGAIVGVVTGAGSEGVGALTQTSREARKQVKRQAAIATPIIGKWSMDAAGVIKERTTTIGEKVAAGAAAVKEKLTPEKTDVEGGLPTAEEEAALGFVPADNTLFEEIKDRVYSTIQPHIEAAVNSLAEQVNQVSEELNDKLDGGVNAETAKISDLARAVHNQFIKKHEGRIAKLKEFMDTEIARITRVAKTLKDPEERAKFIEGHAASVKERASGYMDLIRRDAAARNKKTQAEVDNMDFDAETAAALNMQTNADNTRTGVEESQDDNTRVEPQVGETHAPPVLTFGHMQAQPHTDVNGNSTVKPYSNLKAAKAGRKSLGKRFKVQKLKRDGTDRKLNDTFRIVKVEGGYNIEVIDPEVMDAQKFYNDLESVRGSFTRIEGDNDGRKVKLENFNGPKFGFPAQTKNLGLDVQSMAYKGKNLDPSATTDMDGFLAFAGELLTRGMITNTQFGELHDAATKYFEKKNNPTSQDKKDISDAIQAAEEQLKHPQDVASEQRNRARLTKLKKQQGARESFEARAQKDKEEGDRNVFGEQPAPKYDTQGQAFQALSEFKEELAEQRPDLVNEHTQQSIDNNNEDSSKKLKTPGQRIKPKHLFAVIQNKDGTWSWGFNQTKKPSKDFFGNTVLAGVRIYKNLKEQSPLSLADIRARMDAKRRDEFADKQTRADGSFSVNQTVQGETKKGVSSGDLGDRTGATAGSPDVNVTGQNKVDFVPENEFVNTPRDTQRGKEHELSGVQGDFGDSADPRTRQDEKDLKDLVRARKKLVREIEKLGGVAPGARTRGSRVNKEPKNSVTGRREAGPARRHIDSKENQELIAVKRNQLKVMDKTIEDLKADLDRQSPALAPSQGRRPNREVSILEETRKSQQSTDQLTDGDNKNTKLESEIEDRNRELEGTTRGKNKYTAKKAKATKRGTVAGETMEQTKADNEQLQKKWGAKGITKLMLSNKTALPVRQALQALGNFVTKTLGLSNSVVVMDNAGLQFMINKGYVTDPIFQETLDDPSSHARNIRIEGTSYVYLSPKILSDPALTVLSFGHEMGHHLYRVAWDKMTVEGNHRLMEAYTDATGNKVEFTEIKETNRDGSPTKNGKVVGIKTNDHAFNEWMADQLAAWIVQPRISQSPAEAFFAKVGAQIRKLYDFMKRSKRFELNETFKEFADAVAMKARDPQDTRLNPYNDALVKAWFKNDGVTMYGWFGPAMQAKDNGPKNKAQTETEKELLDTRLQINSILSNPGNEKAFQSGDPNDLKLFKKDYAELAVVEKMLKKRVASEQRVAKKQTSKTASSTAEVDNMAYDFAPVTAEGKKALARVESKYPKIAARAVTLRNWVMNAYRLVGAPATSVMREMERGGIKSAGLIADMFHRGAHGAKRAGRDFTVTPRSSNELLKAYAKFNAIELDNVRDSHSLDPEDKAKAQAAIDAARVELEAAKAKLAPPKTLKIGEQVYQQAVALMQGQFSTQYRAVTDVVAKAITKKRPDIKPKELGILVDAKMREIGESLIKKDGDPDAVFTGEEQLVRDVFDTMHAYAVKSGLPLGKIVNYYPRQIDKNLWMEDKQAILDHLYRKGIPLPQARRMYNHIFDDTANDGRATMDATETPGFTAMNSRKPMQGIAGDPFFDKYMDANVGAVVHNYINQVTKRSEFNRRLGQAFPTESGISAEQALREGLWDPKKRMRALLDHATRKEGATDEQRVMMEQYIDANLGQLGRDSLSPRARKIMANIMAYTNMRVLLFTVFASLSDGAGPAIRSGSMRNTWKTLKNRIGEIASNEGELAEMARAYKIIQDTMSEHILMEYVDNHYMSPTARKYNDAFFKYTGLNWYTDFTRKYALAVGIDYIKNSFVDSQDGATPQVRARGKDMLAELGMSPEQAGRWIAKGSPTYDSQSHDMLGDERAAAEALIQFVDESIMRPNASARPILGSHPKAMLVYHLKGYMYQIHDIILTRLKFNIDESESPVQYMAAIAPAIGMMMLTAVGLELRELIQYAGSGRKPPTDRMDGWEYTWELAQRSGLTGFAQIGFDFQGAEDRGMSHVAGIGGPALSQAIDIITKPSTQTIPKAVPVAGQIPALREVIRNAIR